MSFQVVSQFLFAFTLNFLLALCNMSIGVNVEATVFRRNRLEQNVAINCTELLLFPEKIRNLFLVDFTHYVEYRFVMWRWFHGTLLLQSVP